MKRQSSEQFNAARAFTLIELLVVVGIISILTSLLLPAVARAKGQAKSVLCVNNHRQLIQTFALYHSDFNGALPGNYHREGVERGLSWVWGTIHGATEGFTETDSFTDPERAVFAPYLRAISVYRCPADQSVVSIDGQTRPRLRTYSMNDSMNGNMVASFHYQKAPDLQSPAGLFVFIDTEPWSNCWTPFLVPEKGMPFFHLPGVLHDGKAAVVSFADGHAEKHVWHAPVLRGEPEFSPHGPPNLPEDQRWIRARGHHLITDP
jgi:prepilin-type N-terminal cleavage/methylation domain-containing protein/prepilin-type processing-associated H-X9-DG protein